MSDQMTIEQLLTDWYHAEQKRRKRKRVLIGVRIGAIAIPGLVYIGWYCGHILHWWVKIPPVWDAFIILFLSINGIFTLPTWFLTASHQRLVRDLAGLED